MKRFYGFTLAEVLITLAIIGVVAAISIPSVISNSQQQEFKTGLKKAVSVLNSAITMNMALDGESPYDNKDLFNYLQKHMAILETTSSIHAKYLTTPAWGNNTAFTNSAFYTVDGMRFEFNRHNSFASINERLYLYGTNIALCPGNLTTFSGSDSCGGCGSYGLSNNPDGTTKPPCLIVVDINGDRKPNPANVNCKEYSCATPLKYSDPLGLKLTDLFTIMITDREAIPYGIAAQRAMYQAQK